MAILCTYIETQNPRVTVKAVVVAVYLWIVAEFTCNPFVYLLNCWPM